MKPDQPANIVDDQGGEPVGSREVIRIHKHTFQFHNPIAVDLPSGAIPLGATTFVPAF